MQFEKRFVDPYGVFHEKARGVTTGFKKVQSL
jgi:hypothetical protein